jgi:hypothetical protein
VADYLDDPRTRRDRYEALRATLWTERQSGFDAHWQELGDFVRPRRYRSSTSQHNDGSKANQRIIDSTAQFACRTLASGLHAGLTSPARQWFKLSTHDPQLAKYGPVKAWLHEVTQRMFLVMNTTNIYNTLPIVYGDLGLFGTGAMGILEDSKDLFRCYNYAMGTFAIGLDARGQATTFARIYKMTVRQVIQQFALKDGSREIDWSKVSLWVKREWDGGRYETKLDVVHIVTPNEQADRSSLFAKHLPWASCYYELGTDDTNRKFLRESGFEEFPFMIPRWDVTDGDTYGTDCPGMTALGDVKQLQVEQRRKGQAIAKMVDPPLVGPPNLRAAKTSLLPGDVTYVDEGGKPMLRSIHEVNLRVDHLVMDIQEVQYRIQRAFYEDLFLMLAQSDRLRGQPPTAREVEERHEEKLLALGPVLERTNDELLDRIIDRVFNMMDRAGIIPEAPEALDQVRLKVEYTSIMAQAQKLVSVAGQDRFLQSALVLAESFPEVTQKIKGSVVVDTYADMYGVPPDMIRTDEEVAELMAQQQQRQQAIEEAQVAKDMSTAAKNAGTTPMEGDTLLNRAAAAAGAAA